METTMQKVITFPDDKIIITRYGADDLDIYFDREDCATRGTVLDVVREFATWQQATGRDYVGFDYARTDQYITNPWLDTSGRFPLSHTEAVNVYGLPNVIRFVEDAILFLTIT